MHVRLFPRPAAIRESIYVFPIDAVACAIDWLAGIENKVDEKVELSITFSEGTAEDREGGANKLCTVTVIVFAETEAQAIELHAPFAQSLPTGRLIARQEFLPRTFGVLLDEVKGDRALRRAIETAWSDHPWATVQATAAAFIAAPSSDSIIGIALRRRPLPGGMACSVAGRAFVFIDAAWQSPGEDTANQRWVDDVLAGLSPHETGAYINETNWDQRPDRLAKCFSQEAFTKLEDIRRRYDPENRLVNALDHVVP